jgi:hypothetical protein
MSDTDDLTGFDQLLAAARTSQRPMPSAEELDALLQRLQAALPAAKTNP